MSKKETEKAMHSLDSVGSMITAAMMVKGVIATFTRHVGEAEGMARGKECLNDCHRIFFDCLLTDYPCPKEMATMLRDLAEDLDPAN